MTSNQIAVDARGEVRFAAIWRVVVHRKYLVAALATAFTLAAVVLALTATPMYRADIVIMQVHQSSVGGAAGSVAAQLGEVASLAGVSLSSGMENSREPVAVLKSRDVIEKFIEKYRLLPTLFTGSSRHANMWFGVQEFASQILTIHEDPREGETTVSIRWKDPVIAARWANDFVALANELLRERDLQNASRDIAYLKDQIANTRDEELRLVLYNLMQSETKTLMLANERPDYAFMIIDAAAVPGQRVSPKRTLIVIAGLMAGILFGVISALAINVLWASDYSDEKYASNATWTQSTYQPDVRQGVKPVAETRADESRD